MIRIVGPSRFESPAAVTSVPLATPEGARPNDIMLATLLGPPQQPTGPWEALYSGWQPFREVLHSRQFTLQNTASKKLWSGAQGSTFTFVPGTGQATLAAGYMLGIRDGFPVAFNGWPLCEMAGDKVCDGFKGNEPSPCYPAGCSSLAAPTPPVLRGEVGIYFWAAHDEAGPIGPPEGHVVLVQETVGKMSTLLTYAEFTDSLDSAPPAVATPARPGWMHGLTTVVVVGEEE